MRLMEVAADGDEMHDREDAGAPVIVLLHLAIVREHARNVRVRADALARTRADHRVDVAVGQELAQRLARLVDLYGGLPEERHDGRIAVRAGLPERALHPADFSELDAVFVLQQATDPDRGTHRVERHADAPAFEVLRRADARLAVEEDESVAEDAGREGGDGDERTLPGPETADEFRARHFRRVEFELAAHAVENVARLVVGEEGEVDAVRTNLAGIEAQHAVIEAAGECQRELPRRVGGGRSHVHVLLQTPGDRWTSR